MRLPQIRLIARLLLFVAVTPLSAREVAITIDDLPRRGDSPGTLPANREMTYKLLEPFRRGRIPLIGLVNECHHKEELRPLLALWVAAGSDIGNHTCSHVDLNNTVATHFESEIVNGEAATTTVLGHRPVYFRYPFLGLAGTQGRTLLLVAAPFGICRRGRSGIPRKALVERDEILIDTAVSGDWDNNLWGHSARRCQLLSLGQAGDYGWRTGPHPHGLERDA